MLVLYGEVCAAVVLGGGEPEGGSEARGTSLLAAASALPRTERRECVGPGVSGRLRLL